MDRDIKEPVEIQPAGERASLRRTITWLIRELRQFLASAAALWSGAIVAGFFSVFIWLLHGLLTSESANWQEPGWKIFAQVTLFVLGSWVLFLAFAVACAVAAFLVGVIRTASQGATATFADAIEGGLTNVGHRVKEALGGHDAELRSGMIEHMIETSDMRPDEYRAIGVKGFR